MLSYFHPGKLLSEGVVRAPFCLALWHEVAVFQQPRSIFLEEPLDGSCARLVRPNVDIADALLHEISIVSSIERGERTTLGKSDFWPRI